MVRKIWIALLMLMTLTAGAVAEGLTVQLVTKPVVEPYPGLNWKSDFEDAVNLCRGNNLYISRDMESGVSVIIAPNASVSGYMPVKSALVFSNDVLGAVCYELDGGEEIFTALKTCYCTLYGEQISSDEGLTPYVEISFDFRKNGVGITDQEEDSEDADWWDKVGESIEWTVGAEVAETCVWDIDSHTRLTMQLVEPNTFLGSRCIYITYTAL